MATAACGGDSRPTTPVSPTPLSPQPQIPNVAGTYQGPLTITAALAGGAVMVSLSGTMHITVVQAGAQLTITGAIAIFDETSALEAVTGTVNETGLVTFPPDSLVNAPLPLRRRHLRHPHTGSHDADVSRATRRAFSKPRASTAVGTVEIVGTLTRQ